MALTFTQMPCKPSMCSKVSLCTEDLRDVSNKAEAFGSCKYNNYTRDMQRTTVDRACKRKAMPERHSLVLPLMPGNAVSRLPAPTPVMKPQARTAIMTRGNTGRVKARYRALFTIHYPVSEMLVDFQARSLSFCYSQVLGLTIATPRRKPDAIATSAHRRAYWKV